MDENSLTDKKTSVGSGMAYTTDADGLVHIPSFSLVPCKPGSWNEAHEIDPLSGARILPTEEASVESEWQKLHEIEANRMIASGEGKVQKS